MEYGHQPRLCCDRALFARVWARTGGAAGKNGPIEVLPPVSQPLPAQTVGLDPSGGEDGAFLQASIRKELTNWRAYQALSAQAGGSAGRTLSAMAADERRHVQRLSGAYFLLSGVRYFPAVPPRRGNGSGFWGDVRAWYWRERAVSAAYIEAAEKTREESLAALYRELAAEETGHAQRLRSLAEGMNTNF